MQLIVVIKIWYKIASKKTATPEFNFTRTKRIDMVYKRDFIIEKQIARHFLQCIEGLSNHPSLPR